MGEQRGVGTVLRHLLPLVATAPDVEVTALVCPDVPLPEGVRRRDVQRRATGRFADLEHRLLLGRDLASIPADVMWSPFLDPPHNPGTPWVQTVHDVIPLVVDDPVFNRDRRRWRGRLARIRRANRIVSDSHHTARVLTEQFGFPEDRMTVVHLGVDDSFRPPPPDRPDPAQPNLLVVSGWGPHKGFAEAMEVVARVADAGHPHRLAIAGPGDGWMRSQAERQRKASRRPDLVDLVGFVEDLVGAYWDAEVVLVPSRYEGFGLPLLEAMACARPVVGFSNSSLVEVAGNGAVLVPDADVDAMTGAVLALLAEPRRAAVLTGRAIAQAANFRWEDAAAAYKAIFLALAERR